VNHQQETERLAERVRQGREPRPDFVLWPENSTDIDPTLDSATRAIVQSGSEEAGVPILVGAVMQGPDPGERQTSALWWDPERGVLARYDKRNLVPFGEWIPLRDWLLPRLPVLRQVGAQSVPGTRPGVLQVSAGGRPMVVGVVLCFELAYDQTVQDTLTGGAQVSVVQSNNATYGGTGQVQQQFAITRARAMESRREIAVATTNSISGLVDRDGRVVTQTAEFTAASGVVQMPLRTALTPAVRFGAPLNGAISAAGLLFCFAAGAGALRGALRRTTRTR
jgi:apolipoprotein N-acyltransferase